MRKHVIDIVQVVVMALLITMAIRSFAFEIFKIPSGSMKPNLLVGDYVLVTKYPYGYGRYSFPFGLIPFRGRIFFSPPERGDVMVFRRPNDPSVDFIKRLVGLPGDTVAVRDGRLFINGDPVLRETTDKFLDTDRFPHTRVSQFEETLPEGRVYRVLEAMGDNGFKDNTDEFRVPKGHYFVMGDNRDNSIDSRYLGEIGFVPKELLIGRAEFVLYSLSGKFHWARLWQWGQTIRLDRFFEGLR